MERLSVDADVKQQLKNVFKAEEEREAVLVAQAEAALASSGQKHRNRKERKTMPKKQRPKAPQRKKVNAWWRMMEAADLSELTIVG